MATLVDAPAPRHLPPLTPARRVVLVVGCVLALAAFGQGALTLVSLMGHAERTSSSVLAPPAGALSLRIDSGDIVAEASSDGQVHLDTRERFGLRRPRTSVQTNGSDLSLQSGCVWYDTICSVRYSVSLPSAVPLVFRTGSGDVVVRGLSGDANLETGSGEVRLEDAQPGATDVRLRTGSGDVHATGLTARTVDASTGSGDVSLTLTAAAEGLTARTGSGDVSVRVPAGLSYAVEVHTGSGDSRVDVPVDPASPHRIVIRTGSGDVAVRTTP